MPFGPTRRQCVLGAALAPVVGAAQEGEPRVALVIGNAAYPTAPLMNSVKDAQAMAVQLASLGFSVIELRDAKTEAMRSAVAAMREKLAGRRGTGLFYFAGHGLQLDWRNYLLPLDANPGSAEEVRGQCVDMQDVFNALRDAKTRVNVVVLDACRENPFSTTASGKGLAPLDAPVGTYIAYATAPGHVADDGRVSSGNGLFTGYLLEQLRLPNARIEDVFKRVRVQVQAASLGRQVPWDSSSLVDDFYFSRPAAAVGSTLASAPVLPAVDEERQQWEQLAQRGTIEDITAFLVRYPNGRFAEPALHRLDHLQGGRIVAQPGPRDAAPLPPGRRRYEVGDRLRYRCAIGRVNPTVLPLDLVCSSVDDEVASWNRVALTTDQLGTVRGYYASGFGGLQPPETLGGPVELSVGRRWRTYSVLASGMRSAGGWAVANAELEHHALARERIEVPVGAFDAIRVEATGRRMADRNESLLRRVFWIDPATMTVLRIDAVDRPTVVHNPNPELPLNPASLEFFQRFELAEMRRVAR